MHVWRMRFRDHMAICDWTRTKKEIKAPWASLWMNSWFLNRWQNESLCKTIRMKMHVTCTFILLKFKSFSCEMFCTSIPSKKETTSTSEVEVKSAYEPSGPSGRHLSQFLCHEATRVFLLPLGWDASWSQGHPAILNLPLRIYRGTVRVKCLAQEHNTMFPVRARGQTARNRKEIQKSNSRLFTLTACNKMDNN